MSRIVGELNASATRRPLSTSTCSVNSVNNRFEFGAQRRACSRLHPSPTWMVLRIGRSGQGVGGRRTLPRFSSAHVAPARKGPRPSLLGFRRVSVCKQVVAISGSIMALVLVDSCSATSAARKPLSCGSRKKLQVEAELTVEIFVIREGELLSIHRWAMNCVSKSLSI